MRETELARLAKLSPLDYETERLSASRRLGMRAPELDKAVKKLRPRDEQEEKENPLQVSLDLLVNRLRRYAEDNNIAFGYANSSWHLYEDGYWRVFMLSDDEDMARVLAQLCPEVGIVYGKDASMVDRHLRTSMHFKINPARFDRDSYVAVRNGTVSLTTGQLEAHSADHMTTRFVDIDYNSGARCPEWEVMINDIFSDYDDQTRQQIVDFMQEWMGLALAGGSDDRTPRSLRKALFLYGPARCGKSTVFNVLRQLLGTDRIVASRVAEINGRFALESFLSAAAWITEEVDGLRRELDTSRIKCLITGEPVMAQRKGMRDAILKFNGPVGWAGNTAPNFPESSGAIYERVVVIPVQRVFTEDEANKKFGQLSPVEWLYQKGEFPGIFNWALRGYFRLLERGKFEKIDDLLDARENWREQNDPVFAFLRDCCEPAPNVRSRSITLGWAAFAYVKATNSEKWPKVRALQLAMTNAIPEVFPNLPAGKRVRTEQGRITVFSGLRLNTAGIAYAEQAMRDNEGAKGLIINEPELLLGAAE